MRNPDLSKSPGARGAPARSASNNIKHRVRCGYGQAPKGSTKRHRTASPPAPIKPPSLHFQQKKKRGNIPRKPGRQHRRAAIRIRIQMRSQDVSYYNPGAPLWRLRAGPFSPLSRRCFAEMPLIKKQPHLPLAGGGWGGGIQRVGTHPTLCQPPACPCGIKPRPGSQQYSPEQPAG